MVGTWAPQDYDRNVDKPWTKLTPEEKVRACLRDCTHEAEPESWF